jgi:dTMP kinase
VLVLEKQSNMLINITGLDGSGKSTQVQKLVDTLKKMGIKTFKSKAYTEEYKNIFEQVISNLDQVAIMFLFQSIHTQQRIFAENAEKEGFLVVSDRWDESFLSYHSLFGKLSENESGRDFLNQLAFDNKKPDITFFLDIDLENAQKRIFMRGDESFLDKSALKNFLKLREFLLNEAESKKWIILDALKPADVLSGIIFSKVLEKVK